MSANTKSSPVGVEAILAIGFGLVLAWGWLTTGPSNQELLANYAKSKDLWDLMVANKGFAWWSPNYLGGAPTAPLAGTALTMFWQGRKSRLHDRLRYKVEGGKWRRERLAP